MKKLKERARKNVALLACVILLFCSVGYAGVGVSATEDVASGTDATSVDEETTEAIGEDNTTQEVYEKTYTGDGYETTFKIDNKWIGGYTATITIKNTGETTIENWCVSFPLEQEISNIWNANIKESHEDFYVVKNAGWNQDIAAGAEVSFGFTVYEAFTEFPEYYTLIGMEIELSGEDFSVDYVVTEDWGVGYKAEITVTNNKTVPLEDWRLSFDYGDNLITQIWDAEIVDCVEGRYVISCPSFNQVIPAYGSVSFGFLVEPGCSGNLIDDVMLSEVSAVADGGSGSDGNTGSEDAGDGDTDGSESDGGDIVNPDVEKLTVLFGFVEGENQLVLSALSSVEVSGFEFFASFDGREFVCIGDSFAEESESAVFGDEFVFELSDSFVSMEVFALGYVENGFVMESNHFFVELNDGVFSVVLPDSDGDGLEDCYEIYYGSDVNLVDSDGDGLDDFFEVYVSYSSPCLADSDDNGVWDGDEDFDVDGLSVLVECVLCTDPVIADTDQDGLLDGDEVNIYGSDPLVADMDVDGLVDGDEVALGTDLFVSDSDGDGVLDGDERFEQSLVYQVENGDCVIEEVVVSLEGTGNILSNTSVESVLDKDVLCSGVVGLIGEPFEIESVSVFDEAMISFKIDRDLLGETAFEDLLFLWYDEENQVFVELTTFHDAQKDTVSVVTSHFSKYMIVDRNVWFDAWATELDYSAPGVDSFYTVLAIDCSKSMRQSDPIVYNSNISSAYDSLYNRISCNRIKGALEFVDCMGPNDKVAIVLFHEFAFFSIGFTDDKEEIKLALQNVCADGGTDYDFALMNSLEKFDADVLYDSSICTRVVFLSDGEGSCSEDVLQSAFDSGVVIHGIGIGDVFDYDNLRAMTEFTGGEFFLADTSDLLPLLYEKIFVFDQIDRTDSDGDGLFDVIESAGIRLINGEIIFTDPQDMDSDDDGLLDGEEVDPEVLRSDREVYILGELAVVDGFYFRLFSNPNSVDSEGDGILDAEDNRPMEKGIYSEERGDVVVGELTIVSSLYSATGHSFLVYRSYVNDILDFSKLEGGYVLVNNNTDYNRVEPCKYKICPREYVTIGNTGADMESNWFCATEIVDVDSAGIFFNREFAVEIDNMDKEKQYYHDNLAYTREITSDELDTLIEVHNDYGSYGFLSYNCSFVATKAWNTAFDRYEFYEWAGIIKASFINLPVQLYFKIYEKEESYEFDMRNALR